MQVVLRNQELAGMCVAWHGTYPFDANGVVTCSHLDDIVMLVKEKGCKPIQIVDGGDEKMNYHMVDFDKVLKQGDDHLLEELKRLHNEHWKPFISKDKVVLFYKG
jgi:hypothetical protein